MTEEISQNVSRKEILRMTAEITVAFLSQNKVNILQVPDIIKNVFKIMNSISLESSKEIKTLKKPFVSVRRSVLPDFIICLEDGRKMKMLKRHLRSAYDLSPDEYRSRWGLPHNYPMVAPNYAKRRSEVARNTGLGRKES